MSGGCNTDCSCCVDGQCKSAISCNSLLQLFVIVGSIFGALLLLIFGLYISFKVAECIRKRRQSGRVMGLAQSSGRTRMVNSSGDRAGGGVNDSALADLVENEENSNKKVPLVRAYPDKDIPTTVPYTQLPPVAFKISKLEPVLIIVGDKPVGRPRYMTESIKSLTNTKGKVEVLKSVVVKQNSNFKSSASNHKPSILEVEEVEQNDISNLSLMDRNDSAKAPLRRTNC